MSPANIAYLSTRGSVGPATFLKAMETGLAADGGLYLPDRWPDLSSFWHEVRGTSIQQIGIRLARSFIPELAEDQLEEPVTRALSFDAPLVRLHDDLYILELFHGPTLAFKDFGARFMARMMSLQARRKNRRMIILVATSGDTGSAVGRAFEGLEGIEVCLLYPGGKVSRLQEQQLTTIGGNVTALEVEGTFDDCQKMVKEAFSDDEMREELVLSSANSINIGRLLPQMFYYGRGLAQLDDGRPPHFCVPSGNFGNLTAGMMAAKTGLPARRFIAATNSNDTVPIFLEEGNFIPRPSQKTLSSAMDVGNPSNLERIRTLYPDLQELKKQLWSRSFNDRQTKEAISEVCERFDYVLDPHTAVGYNAARQYTGEERPEGPVIILGTAHPAKFAGIVEPLIDGDIPLPEALQQSLSREKESTPMPASYEAFKSFLREEYT